MILRTRPTDCTTCRQSPPRTGPFHTCTARDARARRWVERAAPVEDRRYPGQDRIPHDVPACPAYLSSH